jgi:predicted nucleic acid-binding protein
MAARGPGVGALNAYFDASAVLAILTGEPERIRAWDDYERRICSSLAEVECLRVLDRMKLKGLLSEEETSLRRDALSSFLDGCDVAEMTRTVLRRAGAPLPFALGTLDSIHLATSLAWQDASGEDIVMATHDKALGNAARAFGLAVVGV